MATADNTPALVVEKLKIPAASVFFVLFIGLAMLAMKNLWVLAGNPTTTMWDWMLSWCIMLVGFGVALYALVVIDNEWEEDE